MRSGFDSPTAHVVFLESHARERGQFSLRLVSVDSFCHLSSLSICTPFTEAVKSVRTDTNWRMSGAVEAAEDAN